MWIQVELKTWWQEFGAVASDRLYFLYEVETTCYEVTITQLGKLGICQILHQLCELKNGEAVQLSEIGGKVIC